MLKIKKSIACTPTKDRLRQNAIVPTVEVAAELTAEDALNALCTRLKKYITVKP